MKKKLPWFGPGERPKWVCANCGKEVSGIFDFVPSDDKKEEEAFCDECLVKAVRWGIKKWREAGSP